jgi:hypothetical protein
MEDLGPIATQSLEVWKAMLTKNQLLKWRFNNFRRNAVGLPQGLSEEERKELTSLREHELAVIDKAMEAQRKKMYELAQPKPHQFELCRAQ